MCLLSEEEEEASTTAQVSTGLHWQVPGSWYCPETQMRGLHLQVQVSSCHRRSKSTAHSRFSSASSGLHLQRQASSSNTLR